MARQYKTVIEGGHMAQHRRQVARYIQVSHFFRSPLDDPLALVISEEFVEFLHDLLCFEPHQLANGSWLFDIKRVPIENT